MIAKNNRHGPSTTVAVNRENHLWISAFHKGTCLRIKRWYQIGKLSCICSKFIKAPKSVWSKEWRRRWSHVYLLPYDLERLWSCSCIRYPRRSTNDFRTRQVQSSVFSEDMEHKNYQFGRSLFPSETTGLLQVVETSGSTIFMNSRYSEVSLTLPKYMLMERIHGPLGKTGGT